MNRLALIRILLLVTLPLIVPASAFAHREDYADETLVFLTLHKNELEPEY